MTMSEAGIRGVRVYLNSKSSDELIEEIVTLVKTFPEVKEYYQVKLSPKGDSKALAKYQKIIRDEFFPAGGFGKLQLSNVHKALKNYKKISDAVDGKVELMVYFVEQGAQFIQEFGDIDEDFYESMESVYEEASKLVATHNLKRKWRDRFYDVVRDTDDTGYGFGDAIRASFEEFFSDKK